MTTTEPVDDWASDYDIFQAAFVRDPYAVWAGLRDSCPIAHSDRWGSSWMPTRYEDVRAIAHDVERFASVEVSVTPRVVDEHHPYVHAPPIDSDPPEHTWARRLLLPEFAPQAVDAHEPFTRELCQRLIEGFVHEGYADAAIDYAQQIPPRVIAKILGVPDRADDFTEWVRGALEIGRRDPATGLKYRAIIIDFFNEVIEDRRRAPKDDLVTRLLHARVEGGQVPRDHVLGTCILLLVAGIDTTWSSIGSALWHLAQHPEDCERLVADPERLPVAVEELLRAYSPVTMARIVREDVEVNGVKMKAGDRVLMPFPAANRDPEVFPDADRVVLDRERNRHIAFGVGIHRCAGSNLARMEMRVAIEEWLARIPSFALVDPAAVTWAGGQVRGPRQLTVRFPVQP